MSVSARDRVGDDAVKHGGVIAWDFHIVKFYVGMEGVAGVHGAVADISSPLGRSTREAGDEGVDAERGAVSEGLRTASRPSSGPSGHRLPEGEEGLRAPRGNPRRLGILR